MYRVSGNDNDLTDFKVKQKKGKIKEGTSGKEKKILSPNK